MKHKPKILSELEKLAPLLPSPMFWVDVNCVLLGFNDLSLKNVSEPNREKMIGKTPYDLYPKDIAETIVRNNTRVIQEKK